jgi:hypothetical protein
MKKKELLKRIEALETLVLRPETEALYVPSGILNSHGGIVKGSHYLYGVEGSWGIMYSPIQTPTAPQFKLEPCAGTDLKDGDVALLYLKEEGNELIRSMLDLECYCLIIQGGFIFWSKDATIDVCTYALNSNYRWYKVVEA